MILARCFYYTEFDEWEAGRILLFNSLEKAERYFKLKTPGGQLSVTRSGNVIDAKGLWYGESVILRIVCLSSLPEEFIAHVNIVAWDETSLQPPGEMYGSH